MPMLVLTGEKAGGTFLIDQAKLVATNVRGQVVTGSGHWLMEEAPQDGDPRAPRFPALARGRVPASRDSHSRSAA